MRATEFITEKWSKKYKKSINCAHPKGFSQKAHCAGRKARRAGKKTKSKSINESRGYIAYSVAKKAADDLGHKVVRHPKGYFQTVERHDPRSEIKLNQRRLDLEPTLKEVYKKLKDRKKKFLELKSKVDAGFLYGEQYESLVTKDKYKDIIEGIKGVRRQLRNLPIKYELIPSAYTKLKNAITENIWSFSEGDDKVQILTCPLFNETLNKHSKVTDRLKTFIDFKKQNPIAQFGKGDTMLGVPASPYGGLNLRHAHLTRDLSIVYTIEGKNPTIIKLFGIFGHDDLGTGTPMKMKNMQSMSSKFQNQNDWT